MTVKIIDFNDWSYVHDDAPGGSHGGTLDPATVTYGVNIDGSENRHVIAVPCPFEGCGSVSYWPPGGGADALLGQSLHVVMEMNSPGLSREAKTVDAAASAVKERVVATDGEERWILDDAAVAVLEATLKA
jgi:hypothetical protein